MVTKIDSYGRIVIPKPIRERLGLQSGVEVELSLEEESLKLIPTGQESGIKEKEGLLVCTSDLSAGADEVLKKVRTRRLKKVAGQ